MSPERPPAARHRTRRLLLLPALVALIAAGAAPATVGAKKGSSGKGGHGASDNHKPYGKGDGRKFK